MTRVYAVLLVVAACSFDSAGQGGSGAVQGSSDTSAATSIGATSVSETTVSETTVSSGLATDAHPSTTAADGSSGAATDTTSAADSGGESGDVPPELGPFAPPQLAGSLATEFYEDDPTLTSDMLEIYFASLRPGSQGGENIWRATRASVGVPFDPPAPVEVLNGPATEGWPELSLDGLTLTFGSDRNGFEQFDVFIVERDTIDDEFGSPALAVDLSTPAPETSAVFSASMLEVFLCSPVGSGADLQRATRLALGDDFGASAPLLSVNSSDRDCTPFVDPSGTRILFSSTRAGSLGDYDIWTALRAGDGDTFEEATNVDGLNSEVEDGDPWWAPDGSAIWFASMRGNDDLDIYYALQR
ncbi:MAG TPA: hypothetical protein VFG69_15000 [Nannocystaceae bacterium]|nr:hypothetical protein [Nannocystaceae bacterium]